MVTLPVRGAAALRVALTCALLAAFLAGTFPISPTAAQDAEPYDLAATVLPVEAFELPDDAEGFGLSSGRNAPLEGFLANELVSSKEYVEAVTEAGWVASYSAEYRGGPGNQLTYRLSVSQFEDDSGAEEIFELASQHLGASRLSLQGSDEAASAPPVYNPESGVTILFVVDDALAFVTGLALEPFPVPDEDALEPLAEKYLERIEEVQEGDAPGLSSRLRQMSMQSVGYGAYRRIDGDPIPRWKISAEVLEETLGEDARDVYAQRQVERLPDTPIELSLYYDGYLFRFDSDDEAEAFIEDAEVIVAADLSVGAVDELDDAPDVGDGAVALTYESVIEGGRVTFVATSIIAHVDEVAFRIDLGLLSDGEGLADVVVPLEAVEEIALQQVGCIEDGCPEDLAAIPDSVEEAAVDVGENDTDDDASDEDGGTGSDGDDSGNVYESPTYGYTVTWGTLFWEVAEETSSDGEDVLVLTNTFSQDTTARFTGTDDYDAAEECLEGAVDELLADPDFEDFEQSGADGDQPFEGEGTLGPYTGYTDGETFVVLTCGALPSGDGVLLATLTTPLDSLVATYFDFDFLLQQIEY